MAGKYHLHRDQQEQFELFLDDTFKDLWVIAPGVSNIIDMTLSPVGNMDVLVWVCLSCGMVCLSCQLVRQRVSYF